ncbi:MAG: gamma-glutamyl-gamma-aminobutyrate hydrolase family protein [Fimbriimonadaceae bacterium]|nr:gamma-glutamyl-gamma-aminobutyrate hydrolase family protein [Fimbriimonadaceae bacterium]
MKPIIGITVDCRYKPEDARTHGDFKQNWNYPEMIAEAGGVPFVIPPMADMNEVAQIIDGWMIPGGDDMNASRFGEENHPKVVLQDPKRYDAEAALWEAVPSEMPVLGICYGCQFLNVVRGGTLIQHLPDVVHHENHSGGTLETISLKVGSKTAQAVGTTTPKGKSYHHQAVGRLGEGLAVSGCHEDGTIEAFEATDRPWLIAVQWHPERTPDDAETKHLFRAFVEAAMAYKTGKGSA